LFRSHLPPVMGLVALVTLGATSTTPDGVPTAVGTATTTMTALELSVGDLGDPETLAALELVTAASRGVDRSASARLVPLRVLGNAIGTVHASSTDAAQAPGALISHTVGPLTAEVAPSLLSAWADEDASWSGLDSSLVTVEALGGALRLAVEDVVAMSEVTGAHARAVQRVALTGLDLDLGHLLPGGLLDVLPLDVLLDLLARLPVDVGGHVALLRDQVLGALDDLTRTTADLASLGNELAAAVVEASVLMAGRDAAQAALDAATRTVDELQDEVDGLTVTVATRTTEVAAAAAELTAAEAELTALRDDRDTASGLLGDLTSVGDALALLDEYDATCAEVSVPTNLLTLVPDVLTELGDLVACLDGLIATSMTEVAVATSSRDAAVMALQAAQELLDDTADELAAASALLPGFQAALDDATALLTVGLAEVEALVAALREAVADLLSAAGAVPALLEELLAHLDELRDGLAGAPLVDLGRVDLSVEVVATGDLDTTVATLTCRADGLALLGRLVGDADCTDPLTPLDELLGPLLGELHAVLGALPGAAGLPTPVIDLFGDASTSTGRLGTGTVAEAGATALRLLIPSVVVDPAAVVPGLLASAATDLVSGVTSALPPLSVLDAMGLAGAVAHLAAIGVDVSALAEVEAALAGLLALVPDGSGLDLARVPGIELVLDPVAHASFTAAPVPGGPGTDPTDPTDPAGPGNGTSGPLPGPDPGSDPQDPGGPGDPDGGVPPPQDDDPGSSPPPDGPPALPTTGGGAAFVGYVLVGTAGLLRRRSTYPVPSGPGRAEDACGGRRTRRPGRPRR